jgi:hypothetical protein
MNDDDAPEVIIVNNEGGDPPPDDDDDDDPPTALPAEVAAAIDLAAAQAMALAAERVESFVGEVRAWQEAHEANGHGDLRERLTMAEASLSLLLTRMPAALAEVTREVETDPPPVVESGGADESPPTPEAPPSGNARRRRYVLI